MKIMIEAIGCMASAATINQIHAAGYLCVGIDANPDCFAKELVDEFYQVPYVTDPDYQKVLYNLAIEKKVNLAIPSLDDSLLIWSDMRDSLKNNGVNITLPNQELLRIFLDKWETYKFFKQIGIPTPKTSLKQKYQLVKPRLGRGGDGVIITNKPVNMCDMISQELLSGKEYTTDVLCDLNYEPIYIVPRLRKGVKEGKSTGGEVIYNEAIIESVKKICKYMKYTGAFNIQCFEDEKRNIKFTELNPRLGGGTILSMAATENWIPFLVNMFVNEKNINPMKKVQYGLKMGRYYSEVFYQ